jgi:predicted RNA-binding Zn-ribbon protein involved in translation (DUF1610 family)
MMDQPQRYRGHELGITGAGADKWHVKRTCPSCGEISPVRCQQKGYDGMLAKQQCHPCWLDGRKRATFRQWQER